MPVFRSIAVAVTLIALGTAVRADDALRSAYADGFRDGFAAARGAVDGHGRAGRSAIGVSEAAPSAPLWIVTAAGGQGLPLPPAVRVAGTSVVYYKGPWIWTGPNAEALMPGGRLDVVALDRSETLVEAGEVEPDVADAIRRMRALGLNEGVVIVAAAPVN
jgi:hypothetical protein